jgi:Zn-dependent protease with chaperone function
VTGPPPASRTWDAYYLDGRTAARQRARVHLLPTGLEVVTEGGARLWWPYAEVRQTQGAYAGEPVRLERGGELPEALLVSDVGILTALHRVAPLAARRFHDPARRRFRAPFVLAAGLAAVAIVAALYLWGIPFAASVVASRVPVAWEERLGRAVVDQLAPAGARCVDPEGARQLDAIVARLTATIPDSPYTIRVAVVDRKPVNAFAAPGGHVVLFGGLVEQAGSPEEVAGIIAHEIQHVVRRHVTRALVQQASTGLLLAAVTGDASGVFVYGVEAARTLGTLRYSRQAEEEADVEGLRMLQAAGIDPAGMVTFFESLRRNEPRLSANLGYLSTHPSTTDRLARLRAAMNAPATHPGAPLLSPGGWAQLKAICLAKSAS